MAIAPDAFLGVVKTAPSGVNNNPVLVTSAAAAAHSRIFVVCGCSGSGNDPTLDSVAGGSLTWTKVDHQSSFENTAGLFWADAPDGLASGTSLTLSTTGSTWNNVVLAYSYTSDTILTFDGASLAAAKAKANLTASTSWSSTAKTLSAGAMLIGALAARVPTAHAPGAGTTEDREENQSANGVVNLTAVVRRIEPSSGSVSLSGTFTGTPDGGGWVEQAFVESGTAWPIPEPPDIEPDYSAFPNPRLRS